MVILSSRILLLQKSIKISKLHTIKELYNNLLPWVSTKKTLNNKLNKSKPKDLVPKLTLPNLLKKTALWNKSLSSLMYLVMLVDFLDNKKSVKSVSHISKTLLSWALNVIIVEPILLKLKHQDKSPKMLVWLL